MTENQTGPDIPPDTPPPTRWVDPVRWFDAFGTCACGKRATGTLRGPRNESYGLACRKCGEARVRKAERNRAKEATNA